jgi:hypothetical protein
VLLRLLSSKATIVPGQIVAKAKLTDQLIE